MTNLSGEVAQREAVLRSVSTATLLDELQRRVGVHPYTGIPVQTAQALVGMYHDDSRVNALLAVARAADISVCWLDREVIEAKLNVKLTDDQWRRIADHLEDFDEFMENSGAAESINHFIDDVLVDKAGLAWNDEGTELVDSPGWVQLAAELHGNGVHTHCPPEERSCWKAEDR